MPPLSPVPFHLVIPSAAPLDSTQLPPHVAGLLRLLKPSHRITCAEDCPAMPYELALARLNGLPDVPGITPWAAFESGTLGQACAWIKLCHWQINMSAVRMSDPAALGLDEASTRLFLQAMAPYFADDGIALSYWQPSILLAKGDAFAQLRTVSMARVAGQDIRDWQALGGTPEESKLRRLQNEMQMLLYTLPLNDEREAQGFPPVNSFWVTGAGQLDQAVPPAPGVESEARLLAAGADPAARAKAWAELDADTCQRLADHLRAGQPGSLTLCGEHAAQTFELLPQGLWQKFKNKLSHSGTSDLLSSL